MKIGVTYRRGINLDTLRSGFKKAAAYFKENPTQNRIYANNILGYEEKGNSPLLYTLFSRMNLPSDVMEITRTTVHKNGKVFREAIPFTVSGSSCRNSKPLKALHLGKSFNMRTGELTVFDGKAAATRRKVNGQDIYRYDHFETGTNYGYDSNSQSDAKRKFDWLLNMVNNKK